MLKNRQKSLHEKLESIEDWPFFGAVLFRIVDGGEKEKRQVRSGRSFYQTGHLMGKGIFV